MNKNELKELLIAKLSEMVDHLDWSQSQYEEVCELKLSQVIKPHDGYPISDAVRLVEYLVISQHNGLYVDFYGQNKEEYYTTEVTQEKKVTELKYYYPENTEEVNCPSEHTITRDYDPDYDGEGEETVEDFETYDQAPCDRTSTGWCIDIRLDCKDCVLNTDR